MLDDYYDGIDLDNYDVERPTMVALCNAYMESTGNTLVYTAAFWTDGDASLRLTSAEHHRLPHEG